MEANELIKTLNDELYNIETERSDVVDAVRVTVPEEQIGQFYQLSRIEGFDATAKRHGNALVAHIEADMDDQSGLGELFSG